MSNEEYKISYGRMARFFWWCSGADKELMRYCKFNDHVKYGCLGGIVFATGLMAALAGGFAFFTIFSPQGDANQKDPFNLGLMLASLVFGILWGMMIFNLDRYIIASTGKGDGTDNITWRELFNALPRLFMGVILAITISKPLEIRMFKKEIDARLKEVQQEELKFRYAQIDSTAEGVILENKKKIESLDGSLHEKEMRFNELEDIFTEEVTGKRGGRGNGPEAQAIKAQMDALQLEIESIKNKIQPELNEANKKIAEQESWKEKKREEAKVEVDGLDGLLERIKLAHELSPEISWFITLLFLAIELTPIFFKLMIIKSPYDYLEENKKALIMAEHGILNLENVETTENGSGKKQKIIQTTLFLHAMKQQEELQHKLKQETELNKLIIDELKKQAEDDIKKNIDNYKA